MKPDKSGLQQAVEFLIQCLEMRTLGLQTGKKTGNLDENVFTCDKITARCSIRVGGTISVTCYDFLIKFNGDTIYRGIIGHIPILYAKQNQKLRESLLVKESIKGVITIQRSEYSFSKIAIILFDKSDSSTWFASCNEVKDAISFLRDECTDGVTVHYSEIVNPDTLLPVHYSKDQSLIQTTFDGTQTRRLEELAEIIPGKTARSNDYRENGIPYLRSRDIQNGTIVTGAVCLEPKMAGKFSRQLIQEGDILLTRFFGQRKLAVVAEDNLPAIASGALFIIRPFGVSEHYLYRYLTSKTGNAVFDLQLKGIEKGAAFPSISLSDLKQLQVPVYDEETMQDIEHIDSLTGEEGIEAALRVIHGIVNITEENIQERVYDDLVSAGWEREKLSCKDVIAVESSNHWIPDLSYTLPEGITVYFEVKNIISKATSEWATAIKRILQGPTKCFYVLTTGYYYEIHVTGCEKSLKLLHAPSLSEIMDWERGRD